MVQSALKMEFQALAAWGLYFPGREGSSWSCQIIQLVLLTHKVGQVHSLLALEQSPLSGGGSGSRWSHSWAD